MSEQIECHKKKGLIFSGPAGRIGRKASYNVEKFPMNMGNNYSPSSFPDFNRA